MSTWKEIVVVYQYKILLLFNFLGAMSFWKLGKKDFGFAMEMLTLPPHEMDVSLLRRACKVGGGQYCCDLLFSQ